MAKWLAAQLGYVYIDTGAMYRAVTLFALRNGLVNNGTVSPQLSARLDEVCIDFRSNPVTGHNDAFLNGENVENEIRGIEVSGAVSYVAAIEAVRRRLVQCQQEMGRNKGIVMDGRDIGTVVFPDAELKLFVTAPAEVRAQRRYAELNAKGQPIAYADVLANVIERDSIDTSRSISPLKPAADAVLFDNGHMTVEEQNRELLETVNRFLQ